MVHIRELPEYVKEIAREIWDRYRGRQVTLDRRGRPNPIHVFNFVRALYQILEQSGISDIESTLESLIDEIDPDISAEENLKYIYNLIPRGSLEERGLDELEALAETYREMDKALEEQVQQEAMEKAIEENKPEKYTHRVDEELEVGFKIFKPITYNKAWNIFCEELRVKGYNCGLFKNKFKELWSQKRIIMSEKEFRDWIRSVIDQFLATITSFEALEPEERIRTAEAVGIRPLQPDIEKQILRAIKNGTLTKQMLDEFKKMYGLQSACGRLFIDGLISTRELEYCTSIEYS